MQWLLQGTTVVMIGPFTKTSDGYTISTGETLSTAKVYLSKNDAAFAAKACTNASSYSAHGQYRVMLSTADSGTPGRLLISAKTTGCLPVWKECMVVKANPYNSIIIGSDNLDVETGNAVKGAALSNIPFLMRGSSDHYTGKTGLTVSAYVSKDASTFAAAAGSAAEVANGMYQFDASTGDMSGNFVCFRFVASGADDEFVSFKPSSH